MEVSNVYCIVQSSLSWKRIRLNTTNLVNIHHTFHLSGLKMFILGLHLNFPSPNGAKVADLNSTVEIMLVVISY